MFCRLVRATIRLPRITEVFRAVSSERWLVAKFTTDQLEQTTAQVLSRSPQRECKIKSMASLGGSRPQHVVLQHGWSPIDVVFIAYLILCKKGAPET